MIYVQILLILFVHNVRKQNPAGEGSGAFVNGGGVARMVSPRNLCAPHKTEHNILFVLPENSFVRRESYTLLHFDENKR